MKHNANAVGIHLLKHALSLNRLEEHLKISVISNLICRLLIF
jgi:hypothetical protein